MCPALQNNKRYKLAGVRTGHQEHIFMMLIKVPDWNC
jgi:hypothetical protein